MSGITLSALRITGGILVFLFGYHMLNGQGSMLRSAENHDDSDVAISPLTVPILAEPGAIFTAMNYSSSGEVKGILIIVAVFVTLFLITFFCFIFSAKILYVIGKVGLSIVTHLMG